MNATEIVHQARLEGVYGSLRRMQANHDTYETRCVGSGNCCKIGLKIHLGEAWNIANKIKRQFWLVAEDKGLQAAQSYLSGVVATLERALTDESWNPETDEQDGHCAFYNNGCTIYEFRPMVCRAYGVIAPVQEGVCPRKRLADGGHELIWNNTVSQTIHEFDSIILDWGDSYPDLDYTLYMPAGVLKFLLPADKLADIIERTDPKFFMASKGYKHQIYRENWTEVSIRTS